MTKVQIGNATRIYALCEYPSMVHRYVGKTIRPLHKRLASHFQVAKNNPRLPVGRWIAKMKREGRDLCIKLIETVPRDMDWAERERFWILEYRKNGERLLNLTEGGEGLAGHIFSKEHRERIAASIRTGSDCTCIKCGSVFWRKKNEIEKGQDKFCSKRCYQADQVGKPKNNPHMPIEAIKAAAYIKKSKTHCKRGHELAGENLFFNSAGGRGCKECRKIHKKTYLGKSK